MYGDLVDAFDGFGDVVFLFLELCSGGELFDKIVEMGSFTEAMAAEVSFKALGALNYMHSKVSPQWGCEPFCTHLALCMACIALDS